MCKLIVYFVERLLEQEEVQQGIGLLAIGWPKTRVCHVHVVSIEYGPDRTLAPIVKRLRNFAVFIRRRLERTVERGDRRIVNRAQQACDVTRRRCLAATLVERAARLTFEVDDEDIILHDQHLSKMKVTVMTDLHRLDMLWQEALQAMRQCRPASEERIDRGEILLLHASSPPFQIVKCATCALQKLFRPILEVIGSDWLRREFWDIITARERELHFRDASSDLADAIEICGLLVTLLRRFRGQQTLVLHIAVEIGTGHRPRVTLVLNKPVYDRHGAA